MDTKEQFEEFVLHDSIIFEDVYELHEVLGSGKFGTVHRCKKKEDGGVWAAKIIKTIRAKDRVAVKKELEVMSCLKHSTLLRCMEAYQTHRKTTMVMECITGGELFERIAGDDILLTEGDCINFMRQICTGVDHMHQNNILHLDLKPENIMCLDQTGYDVKIIDFGLAQRFKDGDQLKILFGTPEFVAPEIVRYEEIGFGTDMWAVGVICYTLLSGLSPFMGDNDTETLSNVTKGTWDFEDEAFNDISDEAKNFIEKLLEFKKERRSSAGECLTHPWLASRDSPDDQVAAHQLSTKRLKKFVARRRWQRTTHAVRAIGRMSILRLATQRRLSAPAAPVSLSSEDRENSSSRESNVHIDNGNIATRSNLNSKISKTPVDRYSLPVLSGSSRYDAIPLSPSPPMSSIGEHRRQDEGIGTVNQKPERGASPIDGQRLTHTRAADIDPGKIDTDMVDMNRSKTDTDTGTDAGMYNVAGVRCDNAGIDNIAGVDTGAIDRSLGLSEIHTDTGLSTDLPNDSAEVRGDTANYTVHHRDRKAIRRQKIRAGVLALEENSVQTFETVSECSSLDRSGGRAPVGGLGEATRARSNGPPMSAGQEEGEGALNGGCCQGNVPSATPVIDCLEEAKVDSSSGDHQKNVGASIGKESMYLIDTSSGFAEKRPVALKSILKRRKTSPERDEPQIASPVSDDSVGVEESSQNDQVTPQIISSVNKQDPGSGEEDLPNITTSGDIIVLDRSRILAANNSGGSVTDLCGPQSDPSSRPTGGAVPKTNPAILNGEHSGDQRGGYPLHPEDEQLVERAARSDSFNSHSIDAALDASAVGEITSTQRDSGRCRANLVKESSGDCVRNRTLGDSSSGTKSDDIDIRNSPDTCKQTDYSLSIHERESNAVLERTSSNFEGNSQIGKDGIDLPVGSDSVRAIASVFDRMDRVVDREGDPPGVRRSASPHSRRSGRVREDTNNNYSEEPRHVEETPKVRAPVFLQKFHRVEAILPIDREIRFESRIDGFPKPEVVWYKDGVRILDGHGRYQFRSGPDGWFSLVIPSALKSDQGSFMCEARNSAGKARCIAKLILSQGKIRSLAPPPDYQLQGIIRDQELSSSLPRIRLEHGPENCYTSSSPHGLNVDVTPSRSWHLASLCVMLVMKLS